MKRYSYMFFIAAFLWLCYSVSADNEDSLLLYQCRIWKLTEQTILKKYVKEKDRKELFENAIKGMLEDLDDNCELIINDEKNADNNIGLGVRVEKAESGAIRIITPIRDSAAFKAGLWPNDEITHINGKPVSELTLGKALELLKELKREEITLSITRMLSDKKSETHEISLKAEVYPKSSSVLKTEMLKNSDNIAYVRLGNISDSTDKELAVTLEGLSVLKAKALILDLRSCTGGAVKTAVGIANLFMEKGIIVELSARDRDYSGIYRARQEGTIARSPIVLLVDGETSEAAEIFSAALRDNKRAAIVGSVTAGYADQSAVFKINDLYSVKLTVAKCITPAGHKISSGEGIKPDTEVKLTEEQLENYKKHLQYETLRINCPPGAEKIIGEPLPFEDPFINEAVKILAKSEIVVIEKK